MSHVVQLACSYMSIKRTCVFLNELRKKSVHNNHLICTTSLSAHSYELCYSYLVSSFLPHILTPLYAV